MTRVVVDRERCMSAGVCEMEAPGVFELDAGGVVQLGPPRPEDLAAVETAVRACPTGALRWVEEAQPADQLQPADRAHPADGVSGR